MNDVYVYLLDNSYELPVDFVINNLHKMPLSRQERCTRYRHERDKINCVASHILLLMGLKEQFNIDPPINFIYNKHGKPFLQDYPSVFFNFSHCKKGVACALSSVEIGIDIQDIRPFDKKIAMKVCSPSELYELERDSDIARLFCKIWTARESYSKAIGVNLSTFLMNDFPKNNIIQWDWNDCCISLCAKNNNMIHSISHKFITLHSIN